MQGFFRYENKKRSLSIEQYIYYISAYRYNWHNDIELLLVLNGEIEVNKDGDSHILNRGDLILINSNRGHATMALKPDSIAMVLHFDPVYFSNWIKNYQNYEFNCISNAQNREQKNYREIRRKMLIMSTYTGRESETDRLIYESMFQSLIGELFIGFPPKKMSISEYSKTNRHENVMKIVEYLNKHFRDKISLEDLVNFTGYNKSYISQLMKQTLGINYYEYLTRVRMREAVYALTNTEDKISDIAYAHGFSDIKAFNISFKERFGKTPSEYRRKLLYHPKVNDNSNAAYVENEICENLVREALDKLDETNCGTISVEYSEDQSHDFKDNLNEVTQDLRRIMSKINKISNKI
ncbi:AraC family transcriptional regulator [Fusibacter sp. 3D3]|uniref:AraC family transcriptional regulator n=1 Tax=Fusibacter sp. 3D3 TaxID=1048380 RepID=UPI000852F09A|nr:AraC family transcriptional regulator [Fusibacter sp. 3D3]GAU75971.1 DNA-binding response regulator, AraC family [Fusibacter sp. 3D3]